MTDSLEFALLARLKEVLKAPSATEAELRTLGEQSDAWALSLKGQIEASERALRELDADPASPLSAIAAELRRVERLNDELARLQSLQRALELRARELRASWIARQAESRS
jgi:chromosome segregation ATPase